MNASAIPKRRFSLLNQRVFTVLFLKFCLVILVTQGLGDALILGDSDLYNTYSYSGENLLNRTIFTVAIVWLVNLVSLGSAFLVFPILLYILIARFMHFTMPKFKLPWSVWLVLLVLPVGMVWSSILGKEVLFLVSFFIFAQYRMQTGLRALCFCSIAALTLIFLRPTFALSLLIAFELVFFKKTSFIFYKNMSLYCVAALFTYVFFLFDYSEFLADALFAIQPSFQGGNTSFGLAADLAMGPTELLQAFLNGVLGFSSLEHLREPRILVLAVEALFACGVLWVFWRRVSSMGSNKLRLMAALAIGLICVTQMLYGGFNAGSSSRFRSNWLIPMVVMLVVTRPRKQLAAPFSARLALET